MSLCKNDYSPFIFAMNFDDYYTKDRIINLLCKYRAAQARRRHKIHILRNISLTDETNIIDSKNYNIPSELLKILPPRRKWVTLNQKERSIYTSSYDQNKNSVKKTIDIINYKLENNKLLEKPLWYENLDRFIEDLIYTIHNLDEYQIESPYIRAEKKPKKRNLYRPISIYSSLKDRVIISLTAKYLTDLFDPIFNDCSFAFRARRNGSVVTHHDTIERILSFKRNYENIDIWVAECDIQKFFDCVNHDIIWGIFRDNVDKLSKKGIEIETNAIDILWQYLDSYAYNVDVQRIDNSDWFREECDNPKGSFDSVTTKLKKKFYRNYRNVRIGIPQGGAISCFIANLLLNEIDKSICNLRSKDKTLEYIRYCDDMILLSTDKKLCKQALSVYIEKANELKLLVHRPIKIRYYKQNFFGFKKKYKNTSIWDAKSKKTYLWSKIKDRGIPWIGFVGYQIRYDCIVRIRKSSIDKEKLKITMEANKFLRAIKANDKEKINENSRISKEQLIHRLLMRYISMSVGRIKLHEEYWNKKPELCWTAGFKKISENKEIKSQLRGLDKHRNMQIQRVRKKIKQLSRPSIKEKKSKQKYDYYGGPFSYYSILHNNKLNT